MVWESGIARRYVWKGRDPRPLVLERVVAGLATTRRTGGRCRCVLAMGNAVAPVVHSVVARHKNPQCAAVINPSGPECARGGEKRKNNRRCCLLHLDIAASASDDAVEVDAQAVVQAPVGMVVE